MIFTETKILVHFYKKNFRTSSSFSITFQAWKMVLLNSTTFQEEWSPCQDGTISTVISHNRLHCRTTDMWLAYCEESLFTNPLSPVLILLTHKQMTTDQAEDFCTDREVHYNITQFHCSLLANFLTFPHTRATSTYPTALSQNTNTSFITVIRDALIIGR